MHPWAGGNVTAIPLHTAPIRTGILIVNLATVSPRDPSPTCHRVGVGLETGVGVGLFTLGLLATKPATLTLTLTLLGPTCHPT